VLGRSGGMTLQRLVLDYRTGELVMRALYRTQDGPGPNTKARTREVSQLIRTGLENALEALEEGPVESIGTSGFETREDVFSLPLASSNSEKTMKPRPNTVRCPTTEGD
jgi:hypothetical protein